MSNRLSVEMGQRRADIIAIGDILVSGEIVSSYFCCDYPVCKGACCVIGDSGAPLEADEPERISRNFSHFSSLMTAEGLATVRERGFSEIDRDGDLVTPVVRRAHRESGVAWALGTAGLEECAFTHFEPDGSAWCAIERQFGLGRGDWPKPTSCALYPIRVTTFRTGGKALNLHRWDICRAAFEKGRREGVRVYQFLRGPLVRAFGEDFYSALCEASSRLIASS